MKKQASTGSIGEDLFVSLFAETFGEEKTSYLYSQYPFSDIYQNSRFADFFIESGVKRIAIEIDDEATHNPEIVSFDKFDDDLLKQNSMIHMGWDVFRWTVRRLQKFPDSVKDELRLFLGIGRFRAVDDYLPVQRGKKLDGSNLELRDYQRETLDALAEMRRSNETIALVSLATGMGKTVVAVEDAKSVGGRVLFVAHTTTLIYQAQKAFREQWPGVSVGCFVDGRKELDAHVLCGSVQSVALNLDMFRDDAFDYLIVDEAHHASADSYQKILGYFKPKFTLGLTATPERADGVDVLEIFQKTARKLDLKTAVEMGALVPVRCVRVKTNIDITKVKYNSIRYDARDLEVCLSVPERNKLIVDTWLEYVKDKRTVIFCVSVKHAKIIAKLFQDAGIAALAVSGENNRDERADALERFASGDVKILCACDLLNEGWDCPQTEIIFAARPTMSKVLYTQQIGRGMRLYEGKKHLMVFDFVDIAGRFNSPYSVHKIFGKREYRPGGLVAAPDDQIKKEGELYNRGEKPEAIIDYPVNVNDFELVDLFNWQEEAAGMISQMEFVRRVDVQSETVARYIQDGKITPDLIVPISERKTLRYFKEETLKAAAEKYGWRLIDDSNRVQLFMEMIEKMDMSYSYKPVLIKAFLELADGRGRVKIDDLVSYFKNFYEERRQAGLVVEKEKCLYTRGGYNDAEVRTNILSNPFRRFEEMNMMRHTKTFGIVEIDSTVWNRLDDALKEKIAAICDQKLTEYYARIE